MKMFGQLLLAASVFLALSYPAPAKRRHHVVPHTVDRAPGWEIRALTEKAQQEPGVTDEICPGTRQTASGGPVGGIPCFNGR